MLNEVHLGPNAPVLGDVIPWEKDVEGDPGNYGGNEGLAGCGKEGDHSDQVLTRVV